MHRPRLSARCHASTSEQGTSLRLFVVRLQSAASEQIPAILLRGGAPSAFERPATSHLPHRTNPRGRERTRSAGAIEAP